MEKVLAQQQELRGEPFPLWGLPALSPQPGTTALASPAPSPPGPCSASPRFGEPRAPSLESLLFTPLGEAFQVPDLAAR